MRGAGVAEKYGAYLGKYAGTRDRTFEVKVDNDALVIDIEGQIALPLNDPDPEDPEGVWQCKIAPRLYATFDRDDSGNVTAMRLHELVRMRKTGAPEVVDTEVPQELRGHLGNYLLTQLNTEFTVTWGDGSLAIRGATTGGNFVRLEEDPDKAGTWISQATGNTITFQTDSDGKVEGLTLDSGAELKRE